MKELSAKIDTVNIIKEIPKISVTMPVYNAQDYLEDAIKSILNQTFGDFELIMVDDGSTDLSRKIMNSFRDRRLVKLYQKNAGYPTALNLALQKARGKYIARMDSDDLCRETRLEKQVAFLESHNQYAFVGCRFLNYVTPRGRVVPKRLSQKEQRAFANTDWVEENAQSIIEYQRSFIDASVMFRFADGEKAGFYRTYMPNGQDTDLWLRILGKNGMAATLNDALYDVRIHPHSITTNNATQKNRIVRQLAIERLETGTDKVMRGEKVSIENLSPANSEEFSRQASVLWAYAATCWAGSDYLSAMRFARSAMNSEGNLLKSARRFKEKLFNLKRAA